MFHIARKGSDYAFNVKHLCRNCWISLTVAWVDLIVDKCINTPGLSVTYSQYPLY